MNALFIYRKQSTIRVLGFSPDAIQESNYLLENGWKLTASIDSRAWLEYYLNSDPDKQAEDLRELTT